jgi:hypothetical protein
MKRKWMLSLVLAMVAAGAGGCAGGKASQAPAVGAAGQAPAYVDLAQSTLHLADQFYNQLVDKKLIRDNTVQATRALSAVDEAAPILRAVAAGIPVDESKLNWAVFAVEAAAGTAKLLGIILPLVL